MARRMDLLAQADHRMEIGSWPSKAAGVPAHRSATLGRLACLVGMKTFLWGCGKVLLVVALALVIIHLWPVTVVPLAVGFLLVLGLGVALMLALAMAGALGLAAVTGLVAAGVALLAVLAPVWIPVMVVVGIIALVRKTGSSGRPTAAAA